MSTVLAENPVEQLEARFLDFPQVDVPVTHRFAPGVYLREVVMPAGSFVIGHEHTTQHFNMVTKGRASVLIDGKVQHIQAPAVFVSNAGVRKVLYIHEDCTWDTIHPTNETDLTKLEAELIIKSPAFVTHQQELDGIETLKLALNL